MTCPLTEALEALRPHIPPSLVSTAELRRIEQVGWILPDAASSFYLECYLGQPSDRVDLLACVTASGGGRERLKAGMDRSEPLPLGSRIAALTAEWARRGSALHRCVPHLWLAFDLAKDKEVPEPNVLACLLGEYFSRPSIMPRSGIISKQEYLGVISSCAELLPGSPHSPQVNTTLTHCYDSIPPSGTLLHLSIMFSRIPAVYKINLVLPTQLISEYLTAIQWPGEFSLVRNLFLELAPLPEHLKFQLTIDRLVQPSIEFEFHFDHSPAAGYRKLLDWALDNKMCTDEQRLRLLSWPGSFRTLRNGHSWPTRWYKWADLKLVYRPCLLPAAKAYLGFMPGMSIL